MNILRRIARAFTRRSEPHDTPPVIDYVERTGASGDWRKRKLAEAAQKYGRPFKCAGDDMPREIVLRGRVLTNTDPTPRI
jgi:hypothetical protein